MPHYIVLGNFTDEGTRNIRDLPRLRDETNKQLEAVGIKIQRFYTLGQYDVVAIIEAPSDEVMATASLSAAGQGHVRITTLKAFTEGEFYKMIEGLPDS